MLGPVELKESLTNENSPFEKDCIDLFHIEDNDIGDPISMTITLEPKGKSFKSNCLFLFRSTQKEEKKILIRYLFLKHDLNEVLKS